MTNVQFKDICKYRNLNNTARTITAVTERNTGHITTDYLLLRLSTTRLNYRLINNISYIYLINEVFIFRPSRTSELPHLTRVKQVKTKAKSSNNWSQNAQFFKNANQVIIPKKVLCVLSKYVSHYLLRAVHIDLNVARELCLLFLMKLNSVCYTNDDNDEGWKSLNVEYLRDFFSTNSLCYKKITDALLMPTLKGPLIECDNVYIKGFKNFFYRLCDNYRGKGYSTYTLQTEVAMSLLHKSYQKKWDESQQNIICTNLIQFYKLVTLPSLPEIEEEADRLIAGKYKNKKGKLLKRLNKHSKSSYKNAQNYFFVEESILIYHRLTENGLMIPSAGGDSSGGRVVDSFTLMPSWIRKLVKVNGNLMGESDYSCLHPNIAVALYSGNSQFITHKKIAKSLGIDEIAVKTEHLAFFNKEVWQMKESPLYAYYNKHEKWMLNNIIGEKRNDNEHKYKITSRRFFQTEVTLMTKVIEILNSESIYVGYVYDALFFDPIHGQRVKEAMNAVAIKLGVYTTAKL